MKRHAWLGGLWLALLGCAGPDSPAAPKPAYHPSPTCPLETRSAWQSFLNRAADDDNWVKTCSDQDDCQASAGDFAGHVQRDILDTLQRCQDDLRDNPDLNA
ncbi:MAG: hypothetical protein ABUL60_21870, partial [Myxococcales bacterium]